MSEWRETTLGEVADFVTGKLNSNAAEADGIYPFFTCSPETFRINTYAFDCEALLLAGNNANGVYALKYYSGKFNAYQRTYVITVQDTNETDIQFLYYLLNLKLNYFKGVSQGSATRFLTMGILDTLDILLPDITQQRRIAVILSTLDAKIDLLRRQNHTLEQIAQTLFKRWFVEFEFPDANGQPYQSSGGPMVASELGEIPEGWRVGTLGEVITINPKSIGKNYKYKDIEYVDISSVSIGKLDSTTQYELKDAPSRARRLVSHGDTIWSCVRPNRKSYYFISNPKDNLVVSTGFAVLSPTKIPSSFLYALTTTNVFVDYLTKNADGSAYPAVRPEHFAIATIIIPPDNILQKFDQIGSPVRAKIAQNENQIQTLTRLRDTLLPKLMSGQLRVQA